MKYNEIERHLSIPRIGRYLHLSGSKTRAVKLYKANMKLAQAFHPLLGFIEVALRNNVNDAVAAHFGDADWIINQKTGFMLSPSLRGTRFFLKSEVEKAERKLANRGLSVTSGRIVAEQTFGFWTDLFEPHHFRLIAAAPIMAFRNLPSGFGRKEVSQELTKIRKFRNRINHNEPIILHRHNIDFLFSQGIHQSITDVLSWLDPQLIGWIKPLDHVQKIILHCQKI